MFAPAQHVGKINRGKFLNPELNLPADRAFGDPYHSDFHADEIRSGAFEYRPSGQKIVARKVDVDAGIAKQVGDIVRLPVPVFVKKDGTLLVSAPQENRANPHDACSIHPNPCSIFQVKTKCHHFDDHLAECSGKIYAVVELHEAQGSGVTGTLIVEQVQGKVRIVGTVHGLEPGTHGFHVHEYGSIGNDCMDAGGHFNPYNTEDHVGDIGTIFTSDDGVTKVNVVDDVITLGDDGFHDIDGLSIVIHGSRELGQGKPRVACGVIVSIVRI